MTLVLSLAHAGTAATVMKMIYAHAPPTFNLSAQFRTVERELSTRMIVLATWLLSHQSSIVVMKTTITK